jgi:hypothetical protein
MRSNASVVIRKKASSPYVPLHVVALALEPFAEGVGHFLFVFDDENSHRLKGIRLVRMN